MTKLTKFSLPVPAGTSISSEYGSRKIGAAQFHYGIDFAVSDGTAIRSAGAGKVIRVIENNAQFGKVVIIEHAPDQATLYAHLSRIDVVRDQDVELLPVLDSLETQAKPATVLTYTLKPLRDQKILQQ